jgi:Caspase domain
LSNFLNQKITSADVDEPLPFVVSSGTNRLPIWAPAAKQVKILAIGVSKYTTRELPSLEFTTRDANSFAELMRTHGASVSLLTDAAATKAAILEGIDRFADAADTGDTFVLYFAGHGWNSRGIQQLAAADMKFSTDQVASSDAGSALIQSRGSQIILQPTIQGSLALSDVMQHINKLPFRFKLVVIDACSVALGSGQLR